jgi:AcrR family transcriptional regulator
MTKKDISKSIIIVAKELFQKKGYCATTVEDIVKAANITDKIFSESFKSKNECGLKVIKSYGQALKSHLKSIDENVNSRQRLSLYLDAYFDQANTLASEGDPVLNLYYDLRNAEGELTKAIEDVLKIQHKWIDVQFIIMMKTESAVDLGNRLTAALNGLLLLVKVKNDASMFKNQIIQLKSWIRSK